MATNTAGSTARVYTQAQRHYLSAPITVANLSPTQSFKIGTIPAGAQLIAAFTSIVTAFNAGTTNNVSLGNASGGAQLAAAQAGLATVGSTSLTLVAGAVSVPQVDTDVYVTGALSGTAATQGSGTIYVEYLVPDAVLV